MAEETKQEGISVDEFRALAQKVQELEEKNTDLETEKGKLAEKISQAEQEAQRRDVVEFMKDLRGKHIKGADGVVYSPSKAFCDTVEPLVGKIDAGAVVEFAEGNKPARSVFMNIINEVVELAGKDGGMLVALGELAPQAHTAPEDEEKPKSVLEMMEQYESEGLSASEAWKKANAHNYGGK